MEAGGGSPATTLREKLSRSRRPRKDSTASNAEESTRSGSADAASIASRIKTRINSTDGDESGDRKFSKLIHARSKRKQQRKQEADALELDSSQELRGRSREPETPATLLTGDSQSTFGESGHSHFTTDSSDEDLPSKPSSAAPFLFNQPSHSGFLTSSSPDVNTMAVPASVPQGQTEMPAERRLSLAHAATLPSAPKSPSIGPHDSASAEGTQDSVSRSSTIGSSLRESQSSSQRRAVSPGLRLKEALRPGSGKKGSNEDVKVSPSSSPSLSSFFSKDRSGSTASRRAQKSSDTPPVPSSIQTSNDAATRSNTSIPAIVTVPDTPPSGSPRMKEPPPIAPATTVTPPTPIDPEETRPVSSSGRFQSPARQSGRRPASSGSSPSQPSVHRRVHSDMTHQPSKLSQATTPPLTPLEEVKTPGSTKNSSGGPIPLSGFFSSVFNAAQNTANTITNTLNTNSTRPRSATPSQQSKEEDVACQQTPTEAEKPTTEAERRLAAIETIGSGNLSLSHLGLANDSSILSDSARSDGSAKGDGDLSRKRSSTLTKREEVAREEGASAARAVSAAYDDKTTVVPGATPVAEDVTSTGKPPSIYEPSVASDRTPPNGSVFEGEAGSLFRAGSLRSKTDKMRRHRNSSLSNSIAPPMTPATSLAPRVTGFAVANKKRNKDFHLLFKSVPEDDYLIEDYSCALQRDILLAGRVYITEGHICFSSNILGWVTTLVISFDEVVSVEKENTAMVFPNAIAVQTLHARHTFRSLLNRDTTYDLMIGIWKISHPGLQSSENGVRLVNGGTGSKTEKVDADSSDDASAGSKANGEIYDEDDDDADEDDDDEGINPLDSRPATRENSIAGSDAAVSPPKIPAGAKPAAVGVAIAQAVGEVPTLGSAKAAHKAATVASAAADFPGPTEHAPTECADASTHYEKLLKDEVIPAPLGKVYAMVFGASSGGFMTRWLVDEVKVTELQMDDDKKGLTKEKKSRTLSYIKPLNSSIGPKSTKCIITEQLEAFDLEKAASVTVTTQTPDVPSGNVFSTKTRYCFMWGPGNGTRVIMTSVIEWTGKSWLKGRC